MQPEVPSEATAVILDSWEERGTDLRLVRFEIQALGATLLLQAGDRSWRLDDPDLTLRFDPNDSPVTSSFVVARAGQLEFSFKYLHVGRSAAAKLDPTYDALDFSSDHPLSVVAQFGLSPQWQASFRMTRLGNGSAV